MEFMGNRITEKVVDRQVNRYAVIGIGFWRFPGE